MGNHTVAHISIADTPSHADVDGSSHIVYACLLLYGSCSWLKSNLALDRIISFASYEINTRSLPCQPRNRNRNRNSNAFGKRTDKHKMNTMFRGYNLAPRRLLPTGDCGFVVYADPLSPFAFNAAQSVRCQCRNFWPNPHTADLCACGHHACYHSQEPTPPPTPPTPSSPSTVLTIGAYASLMNRISRLEKELDAQNAKKTSVVTAYQPELKEVIGGLRGIDDKVSELFERMEEAEERLFGTEKQGQEVEIRLNELEVKSEELEEELDAVKEGFDEEDEEQEQAQNKKKQEQSHQPESKELETTRVVEITDAPLGPKPVKAEPSEERLKSEKKINTATITTIILAQPPFSKAFSLKRRSSDSNLLELHPAKRVRGQSGSFSS